MLVLSETGTGKGSSRRHSQFEPSPRARLREINCAAIPAGLLESELFGHERGAFGALTQRLAALNLLIAARNVSDEVGDIR